MEPIINISFINKTIDPECSSINLLKNLPKNSKFFIRPPDFQELKNIFTLSYKPKDKEKQGLLLSFNGVLPSGNRVEISDDKSFLKDISIIFVCYKKKSKIMSGQILVDDDINNLFEEEQVKMDDEIPILNINEIIDLKRSISSHIKLDQSKIFQNCIENINSEFNKKLSSSVQDLILRSSQENIKNNFNNLKKSFKSSKDKIYEKIDSALEVIKNNNKQLDDINSTIKKAKSSKNVIPREEEKPIPKPNPKPKQPEPEKPKPKPQAEEKPIFRFNKEKIEIKKKINLKAKKATIKVDDFQIKNISKKEFKSIKMSWLKEDNSDENINFHNNKKILDFGNDKVYFSQQNISDLNISLIIDNPIDNNDYKIFVSIMNKENKKTISEKPLQIVIKIKKMLSEDDINNILNNLKKEIDEFDMYLKEEDVKKIIKDKKGEENEIKKVVKEKLEKEKQEKKEQKEKKEKKEKLEKLEKEKKIKELLDKLERDTNFSQFLNNKEVEEKIISTNFNEQEIKKWIEEKRPNPNPNPNEELINKIIDELEDELYVKSFLTEDELRKIIINFNYDRKKIKEEIENHM